MSPIRYNTSYLRRPFQHHVPPSPRVTRSWRSAPGKQTSTNLASKPPTAGGPTQRAPNCSHIMYTTHSAGPLHDAAIHAAQRRARYRGPTPLSPTILEACEMRHTAAHATDGLLPLCLTRKVEPHRVRRPVCAPYCGAATRPANGTLTEQPLCRCAHTATWPQSCE